MRYTATDRTTRRRPPVGVLLANLGTPDAPTAGALRPYLREFLSDPRVIELPRAAWWLILNLFILPFRPRRSAALYRAIWQDDGSPLLTITQRQAHGIAQRLERHTGRPVPVAVGMRYGRPSIASALQELRNAGCDRIVVLPAYPQYAAATTGSTFDAVATEIVRWRAVPELRFVRSYAEHPGYIAALAASIREVWDADGEANRLVMSFHGIPRRYAVNGDPYPRECSRTAVLLAEALGLGPDRWKMVFQSRFGREPWLKPYADETLERMGSEGAHGIDVMCPGFAADCLETLEEMAETNREAFEEAGGSGYRYIPALNDRPDHLDALTDIVLTHMGGWLDDGPAR